MEARVVRIKGSPDKVDEGIENFTAQVVPALKQQDGYSGSRLLVNRDSGDGMVITFWRDADAEAASDEALRDVRSQATTRFGAETPTTQRYAAAVQHRPQPTEKGNWCRVTTFTGNAANIDEGIDHFASEVVRGFEGMAGFRAAVLLVNRDSGAGLAATVWDSQQDLEASASGATPIRQRATEIMGASEPKVENFEVAHAELLAPVRA